MFKGLAGHVPGQGGGDGPERPVGLDHGYALRHAEAQAADIFQLGDGMLGIGDVAEAGEGPGQDAQSGFLSVAVEQLAGFAFHAGLDLLNVVEEIGQGQHTQALDHGFEVGDAAERQIELAGLGVAELDALILAETAGIEDIHFHGAVGFFLDVFFEGIGHDAHIGVVGIADGHTQHRLGSGRPGGAGGQHEHGQSKSKDLFQGNLLLRETRRGRRHRPPSLTRGAGFTARRHPSCWAARGPDPGRSPAPRWR